MFREDNRIGLGVVVGDHQGQVLASLSENVPLPPSSDDVEALADARAINFAAELGFSSVIIEGDSEAIIKALKSNEESLATYGHMISAVRPAIDAFRNISFSHTRWQGNAIARNLVRHVSGYLVWMEDIPPHVLDVLIADYG